MNRKYGLGISSPYCFRTLERKLKKESERGWMIDKIGILFTRYKSCEPKKRGVQIIFDAEASEYGVEKSPYSQGLEEYIDSSGWVKACDYFKQKVYYNEDPDAVPIETDEKIKLETIKDSMSVTTFIAVVTIFAFVLLAALFGDGFSGVFSSPGNLDIKVALLLLAMIPLYFLASCIRFQLWVKKSERNLEAGEGLADDTGALIIDWVFIVTAVILFIIFVISTFSAPGGSGEGIKAIIKFVTFFIIVAIGRDAALFVRDKLRESGKTESTWIVYAVSIVLFLILFSLREFLLQ